MLKAWDEWPVVPIRRDYLPNKSPKDNAARLSLAAFVWLGTSQGKP